MTIDTKTSNKRTICEVLRELYDLTEGNAELTDRLQEAYVMAKKMDAKLRQYKSNYSHEWWQRELKEVTAAKIRARGRREAGKNNDN